MNQKNTVVILFILVIILAGTTIYFALIKNNYTPVTTDKIVEQQKNTQPQQTTNQEILGGTAEKVVLYQDQNYKIRFTTPVACKNFYSIKTEEQSNDQPALRLFAIYASGSKTWPQDASWYNYALYTQSEYNKLKEDMNPPEVVLTLNSGVLLVYWHPQDGPTDAPENCGVTPEKY